MRRYPPNLTVRGMNAVAVALLAGLAGCNAVGAVLDKATTKPAIAAEYTPPKQPMLVLFEDYKNPDVAGIFADRLSSSVTAELKEHKIAPVIPPARLIEFRSNKGADYRQLKTPYIGRALGAKQILYGDITDFTVDAPLGSDMSKGKVKVFVRVIDANTGETVWPTDTYPGEEIEVESPTMRVTDEESQAALVDAMAERLTQRICQLFYTHSEEEEPDNAESTDAGATP
jgi:TolB-like protein